MGSEVIENKRKIAPLVSVILLLECAVNQPHGTKIIPV
nr:MAG TPA: hypothetical protein [Caudoviricetes sp.]